MNEEILAFIYCRKCDGGRCDNLVKEYGKAIGKCRCGQEKYLIKVERVATP